MILLILRTYFNLFRLTKLYIYVGVSTSGITMVFRMGHPGWVEDVEANNNHIFTCRILMAGPKLHSGMVPRPDSQEILPFGKNRRGRRCRISMCFTCTHVLNDIYMHTHTHPPTYTHTKM